MTDERQAPGFRPQAPGQAPNLKPQAPGQASGPRQDQASGLRPQAPAPDPRAIAARSARLPDEELAAECDLEFFTAGGPGGQHRNKTETGVRLRHRPSGFVVAATERRSQLQNRGAALQRLREKLTAFSYVPKKRKKTRPSAGSKRRRLEGKRLQGEKKRQRRDFD